MNRPEENDPAVLEAAAKLVAVRIAEWAENAESFDDDEEREHFKAEITETLVNKILPRSSFSDGYELAKKVERYTCLDGDSDLVATMDEVHWDTMTALREAEEKWVEENGILPELAIGDEVDVQRFCWIEGKAYKQQTNSGTIVKIFEKQGEYGVKTPKSSENGYSVFKFEECYLRGTEWVPPVRKAPEAPTPL